MYRMLTNICIISFCIDLFIHINVIKLCNGKISFSIKMYYILRVLYMKYIAEKFILTANMKFRVIEKKRIPVSAMSSVVS